VQLWVRDVSVSGVEISPLHPLGSGSCSGGSRLALGARLPGTCVRAELRSRPQLLGVGGIREIHGFPPSPRPRLRQQGGWRTSVLLRGGWGSWEPEG